MGFSDSEFPSLCTALGVFVSVFSIFNFLVIRALGSKGVDQQVLSLLRITNVAVLLSGVALVGIGAVYPLLS
jgi:hypothetical protein